jgi:PAS domain S-box-containing protein
VKHNLRSKTSFENSGSSAGDDYLDNILQDYDWGYRLISEVIADYIFVVDVHPDGNLRLAWASENMAAQTGRTGGEVITLDLWKNIIHPEDLTQFLTFISQMLTSTGKGELECRSFRKDGVERWIRLSARQKKNSDGKLTHLVGAVREITKQKQLEKQLKAALEEKETLLREVHHRVKNNLQTVMSLIQMRSPEIHDADSRRVLNQLQEQIRTISMIHNEFFHSVRVSQVAMQSYLELLARYIPKTFYDKENIRMEVHCNGIILNDTYAMSCGLIVNELVTNALKYAFPAGFREQPAIGVKMWNEDTTCFLQVSDNGVGLPGSLDIKNPSTIGLQLVNIWVKHQMKGTLDVATQNGATYTITFSP